MMKLLTFLGTGNYQNATYRYAEFPPTASTFFQEVLARWYKPDAVVVFETTKSNEQHHAALKAALASAGIKDPQVEMIPGGQSEEELWQIFEKVAGAVSDGDTLHIDITHGFRSLPMVAMLVIQFVREVRKEVVIAGVHYGAYEAKDESIPPNVPVFDLTPFIALSGWMTAARTFQSTGDARDLANFVKRHSSGLDPASKKEHRPVNARIKGMSSALENLSDSLLLNRPKEIKQRVAEAKRVCLESAESATIPALHPFEMMAESTLERYRPLDADMGSLGGMKALIDWYMEHRHYLQALLLMREWMISYAASLLEIDVSTNRNTREKLASAMNRMIPKPVNDADRESSSDIDDYVARLKPHLSQETLSIFERITNTRNDAAHFGFRSDPLTAGNLLKGIIDCQSRIRKLFSEIGEPAAGSDCPAI